MTSTVFLLWIVLLTAHLPTPASSNFDLTVHLECEFGYTNWCVNVFIYEWDTWSPHDFIAEKSVCPPDRMKFDLKFGHINPQGDNTPDYEIMTMISHNCTKTGEFYCHEAEVVEIPAWTLNYVTLNFTLSHLDSKKGSCIHPNVST